MDRGGLAAGKKNAKRLGAHIVFIDESGFLLIPPVRKTWAPRGQTPVIRHRLRHDRISAISALSVSPKRKSLGLYFRFQETNIHACDVADFLRHLLRHLRGYVFVIWDNARIHHNEPVREVCRQFPRLHLEALPTYAPELNPVEAVWSHAKQQLANGSLDDKPELLDELHRIFTGLPGSQRHLRAFIHRSALPPFLP